MCFLSVWAKQRRAPHAVSHPSTVYVPSYRPNGTRSTWIACQDQRGLWREIQNTGLTAGKYFALLELTSTGAERWYSAELMSTEAERWWYSAGRTANPAVSSCLQEQRGDRAVRTANPVQ